MKDYADVSALVGMVCVFFSRLFATFSSRTSYSPLDMAYFWAVTGDNMLEYVMQFIYLCLCGAIYYFGFMAGKEEGNPSENKDGEDKDVEADADNAVPANAD